MGIRTDIFNIDRLEIYGIVFENQQLYQAAANSVANNMINDYNPTPKNILVMKLKAENKITAEEVAILLSNEMR